jgi:hypothetical protein
MTERELTRNAARRMAVDHQAMSAVDSAAVPARRPTPPGLEAALSLSLPTSIRTLRSLAKGGPMAEKVVLVCDVCGRGVGDLQAR